jgi:arginyl-tRNA synthetase
LSSYIREISNKHHYGIETKSQQRIIVDYGGANVAKPLHIGHLRSAIIGESLKRLGAYMGNEMIGDVHLGDWGLQMGLIIEELKARGRIDDDFTISELEEIYPAASARAKEDEKFKDAAHENTRLLQEGYEPYIAIWKHIMEISKADLKKNYDKLDVHFELWKGESDVQYIIPGMVDDLLKRGIAYESDGAAVVDVAEPSDPKEIPPCLIRKSDGAALYATSDLATLVEREREYHPDGYIYISDNRQDMHYTQFFRVARKAGIVPEEHFLVHIGFGTMNGKDGKPFKTRAGGVMRLEHLIADVNEKVYDRILENRDVTPEEARETSKIVGLAAIKYGDLSNQATKDYVFDIDRFTSFEGNTGPYILYTIVRIKSILSRYAQDGGSYSYDDILESVSDGEKRLELALVRFNDVMENAWKDLAPHRICQYIYDVSEAFNSFYHETKILTEPDEKRRRSYLAKIDITKGILTDCIGVLGIQAPDRM